MCERGIGHFPSSTGKRATTPRVLRKLMVPRNVPLGERGVKFAHDEPAPKEESGYCENEMCERSRMSPFVKGGIADCGLVMSVW